MLHRFIKQIAPAVAIAMAMGTTACDGHISINGDDGVPLSELDMKGAAPHALVLAGPDKVTVTRGDQLAIDVNGDPDAVAALRFTLSDDSLGIMRKNGSRTNGTANVHVTMPPIGKLVVAGSGTVQADELANEADLTIAGSGTARVSKVAASSLKVTIAGSGTLDAAGHADTLDLKIAGAGTAAMGGLTAGKADISIAGSGDAAFASDGQVSAKIMGSGDVTVNGNAKCTIKSMGSGTLHCNPRGTAGEATPTAKASED